jgi:hypothetical protein
VQPCDPMRPRPPKWDSSWWMLATTASTVHQGIVPQLRESIESWRYGAGKYVVIQVCVAAAGYRHNHRGASTANSKKNGRVRDNEDTTPLPETRQCRDAIGDVAGEVVVSKIKVPTRAHGCDGSSGSSSSSSGSGRVWFAKSGRWSRSIGRVHVRQAHVHQTGHRAQCGRQRPLQIVRINMVIVVGQVEASAPMHNGASKELIRCRGGPGSKGTQLTQHVRERREATDARRQCTRQSKPF